jgi:Protein of unknown function (DUF3604)
MRSGCKFFKISGSALIVTFVSTPVFAQEKNPERNAYFGETHLHTSWSVDAWMFGNRITGQDDAYKSPNP